MSSKIVFSRKLAMPSKDTFSIKPIGEFVNRYLPKSAVSVDPFARNSGLATYTNDMNPNTSASSHMEARDFLRSLIARRIVADVVIFDPPYSPRQVSECYTESGLKAGMQDTQNARMVRECRWLIRQLVRKGAICLSFGWNSVGMGKVAGWKIEEIMLVSHGGAHNDTICMAERFTADNCLFAT